MADQSQIQRLLAARTWADLLGASGPKSASLENFINRRWHKIFASQNALDRLRVDPSNPMTAEDGWGLIYFYLVDGRVRYVGQTSRRSLLKRLSRRQPGGIVGYSFAIKRCLLEAYYGNRLQIRTLPHPLKGIYRAEKAYIRRYAKIRRLWNQEHNPDFDVANFNL